MRAASRPRDGCSLGGDDVFAYLSKDERCVVVKFNAARKVDSIVNGVAIDCN